MTKKEVRNVAKQSLFDGKTKQETFDDLEYHLRTVIKIDD